MNSFLIQFTITVFPDKNKLKYNTHLMFIFYECFPKNFDFFVKVLFIIHVDFHLTHFLRVDPILCFMNDVQVLLFQHLFQKPVISGDIISMDIKNNVRF